MAKPLPDFSLDELLAQLRPEECEDGYTYRELCDLAGVPQTRSNLRRVRRRVEDQRALGKWEKVGTKTYFAEVLGTRVTAEAFKPKGEETDMK